MLQKSLKTKLIPPVETWMLDFLEHPLFRGERFKRRGMGVGGEGRESLARNADPWDAFSNLLFSLHTSDARKYLKVFPLANGSFKDLLLNTT